jgi:hypothetical protein
MAVKSYKCSQQILYIICKKGWQNCKEHIDGFVKFKAKYTVDFIATQFTEIDAVAAMPEFEKRETNWDNFQKDLIASGSKCLQLWQDLKRYISDGWTKEEEKKAFRKAGQDWYQTAKNKNWESLSKLNTEGIAFMRENREQLLANNNMPASFPTTYLSAIQRFDSLQRQFYKSWEKEKQITEQKILANNAIHRQLMIMMVDGQRIFKKAPEIGKQFVFMNLLAEVKQE